MIPYMVLFSIISINAIFVDRFIKTKNNRVAYFIAVISILLLSIFAGIRDDNVGVDIPYYILPVFSWAQNLDFGDFMKAGNLESGFLLLMYFSTKLFNDYHVALFCMQAIVSTCFFIYAFKQKENTSIFLIIMTFLFVFFNNTLTMMRQTVATSLLLLSICFLKEKKYLVVGLLFISALLFHSTAIIMIVPYAIFIVNTTDCFSKRNKSFINSLIIIAFLIFGLMYKEIVYTLVYKMQLLSERYYSYFESDYYGANVISKSGLVFRMIFVVFANMIDKKEKTNETKSYLMFLYIELLVFILSYKIGPLMRAGFYFTYPAYMYIIPRIPCLFKKDRKNQVSIRALLLIFLFIMWWFTNVLNNEGGQTCPYTSQIFENLF